MYLDFVYPVRCEFCLLLKITLSLSLSFIMKLATTGDNNTFHEVLHGQSAHRQYFSMGFNKLTMGCGLVHFDPGTKQNGLWFH
jgi:hypothetical protein